MILTAKWVCVFKASCDFCSKKNSIYKKDVARLLVSIKPYVVLYLIAIRKAT